MDSEKTGVWLRDGNLVYELMENPNPTRRMSSPVNRWWAQINTQRDGATMDEVVAIAESIRRLPELEAENTQLRSALDSFKVSYGLIMGDRSPLPPLAKAMVNGFFTEVMEEVAAALGTETK